jgi:TRAP-type mannitol/chloroaromatic compound transport system permease small subunit
VQLGSNMLLEAQTYAYNLMFLLGASYVLQRDGHIRVDILYSGFGPRPKAWIDLIGTCVFLIPFCILGLYLSYGYVERSWRTAGAEPQPRRPAPLSHQDHHHRLLHATDLSGHQ